MPDIEGSTAEPDGKIDLPDVVEPVIDLHLQVLVKMLNDDETNRSHFGITLNIPGGVIYGHAISLGSYLGAWEASVREGQGSGAEAVAALPRTLVDTINEAMKERGQERDPLPRWIHLRDATFLTGAPIQTMHYELWRGRLADVVGWSLSIPS